MRIKPAEPRRSFSIYLPDSLYQRLENKAGRGKINAFIKQALEEKLIKEEKDQKGQLKQQLIDDYQSVASSKKSQAEDEI
jgi:metal-responsive CopG/Arc/MetJ family transcriptional regulator